tara:strand:- start:504 stop:1130 length:627 start_codon:yes stop_codon:yes gene_type:complete
MDTRIIFAHNALRNWGEWYATNGTFSGNGGGMRSTMGAITKGGYSVCTVCAGLPHSRKLCRACNFTGRIVEGGQTLEQSKNASRVCDKCTNGEIKGKTCFDCRGSGRINTGKFKQNSATFRGSGNIESTRPTPRRIQIVSDYVRRQEKTIEQLLLMLYCDMPRYGSGSEVLQQYNLYREAAGKKIIRRNTMGKHMNKHRLAIYGELTK